MRYNALTNLMLKMWRGGLVNGTAQQTVCLLGNPGIGKTSTNRSLVAMMTEAVRSDKSLQKLIFGEDVPSEIPAAISQELDLSSMLPEDLNGLPFRQGDTTRFCAHEWLHRLCQPGAYGCLVLDDLPAASPMMQVAARQCALERRIHQHFLAPGVFVIVTGNRREDKSAASTLPAHFRNSVMLMDVDIDVEEWAKWYGKQPHHDPVVAAYLRWQESKLTMLPKDADKRGAFATPRTWTKLGAQFRVAEEADALFDVASGLVGEGVATEFCAFVKVRSQLVDPVKVFDDPQKAMKNPGKSLGGAPDKLVAMATSLGEIAARRSKSGKGKDKSEAPLKLLRALAWTTQDHREYCGTGVSTFISNGGSLPDLVRVAREHRGDPVIGKLLSFLKSALMDGN
jgi:hypothetical protein